MKLFITTFCLLVGMGLYAQNCKPFFEKVDEFSKDTLVFYGGELDESSFFSDKNLNVFFIAGKANDSMSASFFIRRQIMDKEDISEIQGTLDDLRIKKGQTAFLSLSNGESIRMTAQADSKRERQKLLGTVVISTTCVYTFTPAQMTLLAENTITNYRIEMAETILQGKKLKPNRTSKLKSQFECAAKRFH